ncbi:amidohydrolase family protein [Komagataeibacter nataicola]|uniref:Hydantoinase n=1 Tax=Komagataeibacter nataicola TaxID=265960 RepID=A0ABX5PGG1_9PROT|nr:amidohydrolase family protein [Komagataeibacter nataicola]PYD67747.1 hydantoinase [Komagataeibacter nataicola]WNM08954.1 amidohydrolase family protein [Komagataeibacter nataicola]GBR22763.1 dihydropyrimidinase [Komagataeibacter nataicola NRIC 0616]
MKHGEQRDLLLIRGGTVVTGQASLRVDVLCGGVGEILAVGPELEAPTGCMVIDADGLLVLPGGVDPHTGIGADEAGFAATAAALAGGTTTVIDVMQPHGRDMAQAWRDWRHAAVRAPVDVGLCMGLPDAGGAVTGGMDTLVAHGVNSFHLSMASGMADREILDLAAHAAGLGALCIIEAQNAHAMGYLRAALDHAGVSGGEACLLACPPAIEAEAVGRAIMLAGLVGAPVHVGPVSTAGACAAIIAARAQAQRVQAHVLAPHLVLDEAVYDADDASPYLIRPPFRDGTHRRALWGALACGAVSMVASGFSPVGQAGHGVAGGLAERMRVVWRHGVQAGVMEAEEFVRATSEAAARAFNIYPRKGAIMPGADADLVLWNPDAQETRPASAGGLYGGIALGGQAVCVIRGGVVALRNGALHEGAGRGGYVPCPAFRSGLSARMRQAARLSV